MKKIALLLIVVVALGVAYKSSRRGAPAARHNEPAVLAVATQPGIVSAGFNHFVAISRDGDLYGWGANQNKELGLTDVLQVPVPTQLTAQAKWRAVHSGTTASYAISVDGDLRRRVFARSE